MSINEDRVREMAGVRGEKDWVSLRENALAINIQVHISDTDLNVDQARRLARQLNHLAARIEKRLAAEMEIAP